MSKLDINKQYTFAELDMENDSVLPIVVKPVLPTPPWVEPEAVLEQVASPVAVYVRVRPLIEEETKANAGTMPGMVTTTSEPGDTAATALHTEKITISGFTGVMGTDSDNLAMFDRCFKSRLDTVLEGGTASLFCYGYTGSGKSHTVLGYAGEKGLYHLAAEDLLARMEEKYPEEDLFLSATACEIYGEQVFDLMGEEKLPCTLRIDGDGNLCVGLPAERSELSEVLPEFKAQSTSCLGSASHATLVTRTRGLRQGLVKSATDLDSFSTSTLQRRAVGTSTEHNQSSRSHAVLKMEVINMDTYNAREAVEDAKAPLPALFSGIDNHNQECFSKLLGDYDAAAGTMGVKQYEGGQGELDKVLDSLMIKKREMESALPPVMEKLEKA